MTSDADHQVVWRCLKEYNTLVINHPAAPSVITSENGWVIWGTMKKLTQVINHSAAPSVTTSDQTKGIWRLMREPTLVTNHSAALIVITDASIWVTWRSMKKHWWETNQLHDLRLNPIKNINSDVAYCWLYSLGTGLLPPLKTPGKAGVPGLLRNKSALTDQELVPAQTYMNLIWKKLNSEDIWFWEAWSKDTRFFFRILPQITCRLLHIQNIS